MNATDEGPFLDAVFARYDDDRPRLVYADFLDDSGEPDRAELIRVQLALAKLGPDDPRRPPLADRQIELLANNRAAWTAHLAGLVESVDFRRGVPDSASVDAATFLERGDELFRRMRVRRLSLLDAAPLMAKIAASPLLARVRELDLCNCALGPLPLEQLVRSPHLRHIAALDLGFNGLDDASIQIFAQSALLPNLTTLAINDNETIGDAGLAALAGSPFFAGLTELDVSGNDITDAGIVTAVGSPSFARVRAFRASDNAIGDAGATALARSPLLARVLKSECEFVLRANTVGHAGAAALAACPALAHCNALDLSGNYLGDCGLAALLGSPFLGRLRSLKLARNQFTDEGAIACREVFAPLLGRLRHLDLSGNRLTRRGIGVLTALCAPHAVTLDVSGNVQSAPAGDAPVAVTDLLPGALNGLDPAPANRCGQPPRHPPAGA